MTTLDTCPPELLELICSYLPVKFLRTHFLLVCSKFYQLFGHEQYWRGRLLNFDSSLRFPDAAVSSPSFRWDRVCAEVESEQQRWAKKGSLFHQFTLSNGHIATVDSVHLMQAGRVCISGSHDRCLCVWDLSRLPAPTDEGPCESSECRVFTERKGHDGWIWTIASIEDIVYSGAWDQKVCQWQLTPTELLPLTSMKCSSAVLCVSAARDGVYASTYDRQVKFFDARDPHNLVTTLKYHRMPVLGVTTDGEERYVYSCSEDKTVVCFDRRAAAVLHTLQLEDSGVALSFNDNQLWIGDTKGKLHLVDSNWNLLAQCEAKGRRRVTGVKHNTGCVISVSYDRNANFLVTTSSTRPRVLADFTLPELEPTKIDYKNGVLACGFVDSNVRVWMPHSKQQQ